MRFSSKTKISFLIFFAIILTINMSFFIILRTDAYALYRDALSGVVAFLGWLGIITTIDMVEPSIILIGFLTSTISASILLYFGLQLFHVQEGIHTTVMNQAKELINQEEKAD